MGLKVTDGLSKCLGVPYTRSRMSTATSSATVDTGFVRARLGSILGVVPLGIWTINHLWHNLSAFQGAAAWQADVTEYAHPLAFFASSVVALLPLGLHMVWGIGRLATVRPNLGRYRYFDNLRYVLQRLSAIGLVLLLGAHLWLAMLRPRLTTGRPEPFSDIAHEMHHHWPTLAVYIVFVLAVAYHLANGLHTFAMGWGIVSSRRALRHTFVAILLVFFVLLAMGWSAVYAIWDAGA
jgi:succinate dehydrogenase / fumarate reductase cytochrome b subunit